MKRLITEKLINWKNKETKKPLIINGARQVGKTYIIKKFGEEFFDDMIYINFETNHELNSLINDNITPFYIIEKIELYFNKKIGKNTLIFFDEIQASERALTSLKYFCEETEYNIIAAGSLLGVAINREDYSFPVGKVEVLQMHPLSFEEFLIAIDRENLISVIENSFLNNKKINDAIHKKLIELYNTYLILGGMPEVIKTYIEKKSIIEAKEIQSAIIASYISDMTKYASSSNSIKLIDTYNSIPLQLAKENRKFQYKVVAKGGTASIFGNALSFLENAGIINKCYKVTPQTPLEMYKDITSFKVYMADTGLLVNKSQFPMHTIANSTSKGPIVENYVAQQIVSLERKIYYWESSGKAEIDFILQTEKGIIPIEVKATIHTKSRSLHVYMTKYKPPYGIKVSEKNFGLENNVKLIPLYALFCLKKI